MIVANLFLLYLLPNLFCGVFFLNVAKVVVDDFHLALGGGMPGLDDLHSLSNVIVERKDFLELANKGR
jgi:hypothetical protein